MVVQREACVWDNNVLICQEGSICYVYAKNMVYTCHGNVFMTIVVDLSHLNDITTKIKV